MADTYSLFVFVVLVGFLAVFLCGLSTHGGAYYLHTIRRAKLWCKSGQSQCTKWFMSSLVFLFVHCSITVVLQV